MGQKLIILLILFSFIFHSAAFFPCCLPAFTPSSSSTISSRTIRSTGFFFSVYVIENYLFMSLVFVFYCCTMRFCLRLSIETVFTFSVRTMVCCYCHNYIAIAQQMRIRFICVPTAIYPRYFVEWFTVLKKESILISEKACYSRLYGKMFLIQNLTSFYIQQFSRLDVDVLVARRVHTNQLIT